MVTRLAPVAGVRLWRAARCSYSSSAMFYWLLKYVVLGPLLKGLFRPEVDGLANVPESGPVILACNHLSFSDSIFTPLIVRRRVTFVAKAEYFTGKGIKGRLMRWFFSSTGTIPVDRSGGKAAQAWAALPPDRSTGIVPVLEKNQRIRRPLIPLPVKYSAFATNVTLRRTIRGVKIESEKERWLQARITGPDSGTLSRPRTSGRKTSRSRGPRITYFSSQ